MFSPIRMIRNNTLWINVKKAENRSREKVNLSPWIMII